MSIYKKILMLLGPSLLAACAAPAAQQPTNKIESSFTPKAGAAVSFSSKAGSNLDTGRFNTVQLTFAEDYESGDLSVTLVPNEGLDLFGGQTAKVFDMASSGSHEWNVEVKAQDSGIYYLDAFVEAQGQSRAFSVKLEIGTITSKMRDLSTETSGEIIGGVRSMEAEETVK